VANNYRQSGKKIAVASASANITSGALVMQEGFLGVAVTTAVSGASLIIDTKGVWVLPVPTGTVKGNALWATVSADSAALTLKLDAGAATGDKLVAIAVSDRDSAGLASVMLGAQPFVGAAHA
jgi:predicted RecA/RadA family phage recombinase